MNPHTFPSSFCMSGSEAGSVFSCLFILLSALFLIWAKGDQRKHPEWKLFMCFMILNLAIGGWGWCCNYNCFLIRGFAISSPCPGKVSTNASNLHLKKSPLPCSWYLNSGLVGSPGDPHTPVALLVFTEQLAWNGQTVWLYKGRGIKMITTKYTRQSLNVQNLGRCWCWLRIHCWPWAAGRVEAVWWAYGHPRRAVPQ